MKKCKNECCEYYPYFGVAPHKSFDSKGNLVHEKLPINQWGDDFVPELEDGEKIEDVKAPCGMYYCPDCLKGKPLLN
jgi:hypothetical protein